MNSSEMIKLITQYEGKGFAEIEAERIEFFQTTNQYDTYTYEVTYDNSFEEMIHDFETVLKGKVYRPTAKKILNSWYSWAVEQQKTNP